MSSVSLARTVALRRSASARASCGDRALGRQARCAMRSSQRSGSTVGDCGNHQRREAKRNRESGHQLMIDRFGRIAIRGLRKAAQSLETNIRTLNIATPPQIGAVHRLILGCIIDPRRGSRIRKALVIGGSDMRQAIRNCGALALTQQVWAQGDRG